MDQFKFIDLKATPTGNSITIEWEIETKIPADKLSYEAILIGENGDPTYEVSDPLEKTNTYTFSNLNMNTEFSLFIRAYEEPDHSFLIEYPKDGQKVSTRDDEAPTVKSKVLKVSCPGDNTYKIQWEKASDSVTESKKIIYNVFKKKADDPDSDWELVKSKPNIASVTIKDLKAGSRFSFYVEAVDEAGNTLQYDECSVETADTVAPLISNQELRLIDKTDTSLTIGWDKATDNVTEERNIIYQVVWKETDKSEATWRSQIARTPYQFTLSDLKPGTKYSLRVEAFDQARNSSQYSILYAATQDSVAPVITDKLLHASAGDHSIVIQWTPAKDNVTPKDKIVYLVSRTESGKWLDPHEVKGKNEYSFDGLKSGERYSFRVEARDEAGNVTKYAECLAETRDTELPQIGEGTVRMAGRSSSELAINWDLATDNVTEAKDMRYLVSRSEGNSWLPSTELTGTDFYCFSGLEPATEYRIRVIAVDKAGNKAEYPILTTSTKDSIAPTVSNLTVKATAAADRVTLQWELAKDNVTAANKINYRVFQMTSGQWRAVRYEPGISACVITGLSSGKQYTFKVEAYDESDNPLKYNSVTVTTSDNVPPTISNNTISATATDNSVALEWKQAEDNVTMAGSIRYVITKLVNNVWQSEKTLVGTCKHTVTGLSSGKQYSFKVEAFDQAGNSRSYNIVTLKTLDKVAPTLSNKVISTSKPTANSVLLSWIAASDNASVHSGIRYKIYLYPQGASAWSSVYESKGITSYQLTGLSPATKYSIFVRAFDESGNYSDYSTTSVTTPLNTVLSRTGQFYCNGVYPGNKGASAEYLYDKIASPFSRQYFELSFEFYGLFPMSETSGPYGKSILMFGSTGRVFGLSVKDGYIYVSTNNLTNLFNTNIRYTQQSWQSIKLVHDNGKLTINGKVMTIGFVKNEGDNVLTSCDYGRGSNFKGYFRNIDLKSKQTASAPVILSKPSTFACNGVYQNGAIALKEDLGSKLNRNYFEISFDFCPASCDKQSFSLDNIITLDSSYRALGLIMRGDAVVLTKNNGDNSYATGVKFALNQWQHIDLVLNNGCLTINGKTIYLGSIQWSSSNNILSSLNYSNGHAFKGQFKNLVVKSK